MASTNNPTPMMRYDQRGGHAEGLSQNNPRILDQTNSVRFNQLNLQKSRVATANFSQCLINWSKLPCFALLQEPYTSTYGLVGFPRTSQMFFASKSPRAAIIASPDLKLWAMDDFTTADISCCLWKTGHRQWPTIIVVSAYLDITKPAASPELEKLLIYCENKNYPVVMGCDTNSHSVGWGCPQNNLRGDVIDELIHRHSLSVINVGSVPTFETVRARSIIDVSLVHDSLYNNCANWKVLDKDFLSDHKCLEFFLNLCQPSPGPITDWRRTDFNAFELELQQIGTRWTAPEAWAPSVLEDEVECFNTDVMSVLTKHSPTFLPGRRFRKHRWWNEELVVYRNDTKRAYKRWHRTKLDNDRRSYLEVKHAYNVEMFKAKTQSWRQTCTEADSSEKLAT